MSKMDNLRAMREARFEQSQARAAAAGKASKPAPTSAPKSATRAKPSVARPAEASARTTEAETPDAGTDDTLCGHRSMNGRTCTRALGHAAKSHRYS